MNSTAAAAQQMAEAGDQERNDELMAGSLGHRTGDDNAREASQHRGMAGVSAGRGEAKRQGGFSWEEKGASERRPGKGVDRRCSAALAVARLPARSLSPDRKGGSDLRRR